MPLQDFALAAQAAAYELFLLPGDYVLSIVARTPEAAILADGGALLLRNIASALCWLLIIVLIWQLLRLIRNIVRVLLAVWLTVEFRFEQGLRNLRTRLVCAVRLLFAGRRIQRIERAFEVEFDDIDVAVLRNGAGLRPGYTLSVPELAGRLTIRPSLVQKSLDKLRKQKLVECAFGSTDGFENYRLTPNGITLLAVWRRNTS
ncbi:MAG: hypothetical protein L0Y45_01600 [Woeseiaceae bacterium]|nr:hypothetical protein [Woeseiaceae bacterium]